MDCGAQARSQNGACKVPANEQARSSHLAVPQRFLGMSRDAEDGRTQSCRKSVTFHSEISTGVPAILPAPQPACLWLPPTCPNQGCCPPGFAYVCSRFHIRCWFLHSPRLRCCITQCHPGRAEYHINWIDLAGFIGQCIDGSWATFVTSAS